MVRTGAAGTRRADARQNADKIVDAAIDCLGRKPAASMVDIAQAAGVGRVTLYGHFSSREAVVEAALARVIERGQGTLDGLDGLDASDSDSEGDPREVLRRLIESSWMLIAQASGVLEAAQATLSPQRIHDLHAAPERRVLALIERGQEQGVFRDDLPAAWLSNALHHVLKGAAADVNGGRLDPEQAPRFITGIVLAAAAPQAEAAPRAAVAPQAAAAPRPGSTPAAPQPEPTGTHSRRTS
ncbi:TetR/AcrR family transcriptional regulator [Streptomyces sp. N35]|uniref:TetR/AcrR family transcriptional regulator n=1 Tax=Streptomyces sp. N35 TaxID=2795730 RepID=UPI0018F5BC59|nr:TetR/AcrR family transcriptional regulator [Streptomyces sp. N35]